MKPKANDKNHMKYHTIKPTKPLSDYVRFYWMLEGSVIDECPYIHRTLANASPELIFHYKGPFEELNAAGQAEKTFLTGVHAQTNRVRRFSLALYKLKKGNNGRNHIQ